MITVKLSSGEIRLTEEDIRTLKPVIDDVISIMDRPVLEGLELESSLRIKEVLGILSEEQLVEFAKKIEKEAGPRHVTNKIRAELFKRSGLGHKQVGSYLSTKQRSLLKLLGLHHK
ncbi:hypothetical protein [Chryseobacterium rhizosphaerae]|uniref:hypothetical protein n=1 Tax=Chryseobacterium rhizosphaerae TaxID=395937 RepID=UPI003D13B7CE